MTSRLPTTAATGAHLPGPTVTIAIPVLNEGAHLDRCLASVEAQTYPSIVQVLVVDGGSTDDTASRAAGHPEVTVLDNPRRIQAAALNVALERASGDVFIRVDGHCELAPDYVTRCVDVLEESGAALVGGAMTAVATGWFARGVAEATRRPLGAGGARFHVGGQAGWVDTVYLGAGRTDKYRDIGGYAEDVGVNEDTELAHRMAAVGGVWFDPGIRSTYAPRGSVKAVVRQYFRYGVSRAATTRKHPSSLKPRQMFAPLLLAGLASPARRPVALAYAMVVTREAVVVGRSDRAAGAAVGIVLPAMHLSWGFGFLAGILGLRPPGARSPS